MEVSWVGVVLVVLVVVGADGRERSLVDPHRVREGGSIRASTSTKCDRG
jgi:hypothetical protein